MFVSEPPGSKNYILNVGQISEHELELGGEKALNLGNLSKLGAPISKGFILSSQAFDDFLFANGLIPVFSEINRKVLRGEINSAKAEQEISKMIFSAKYPKLLGEMLYRAYVLLVENKKMPVQIELSSLNTHLKDSVSIVPQDLVIASSFEEVANAIKMTWIKLFGRTAIDFRKDTKYKGILSTAIVINKFVQPELNGSIYTLGIDNANPNITEIRAMYGLAHEQIEKNNFVDRYLFKKDTEEIVGRYVNEQDWMLILKNNKLGKLSISPKRGKNQKLTDQQIHRLANTTTKLKAYFNNELKIEWIYASGKFTFTGLERLRENELIKARTALGKIMQNDNKKTVKNKVEITPERFELQPINKLPRLLSGIGNQHGLVYGRVRVVHTKDDLQRVGSVDIAVISKSVRNIPLRQFKFRGIVIEGALEKELEDTPIISNANDATRLLLENEVVTLDTHTGIVFLGAGHSPVVHERQEQFIDVVRPDTIHSKEITIKMQRPVTQGIFKPAQTETVSEDSKWLPNIKEPTSNDEPVFSDIEKVNLLGNEAKPTIETISRSVNDDWYLKSPVFSETGLNFKTNSKYWQIINPENPVVLDHVNGAYFSLGKYLKALDIDKYELLRNKPLKNKFIEFFGRHIQEYSGVDQILFVLDMAERSRETINDSSLFELELEIVKYLRNKLELRNTSIVLPDVRTETDLTQMKKLVTASGLRRTATFKVLAEVSSPLAAISIRKIIDDGIDTLVVDVDKLLQNLYQEDRYKLTQEITGFLGNLIGKVTTTAVPVYLAADKVSLTDDDLKEFVEFGVTNFVFPEAKIRELAPILANLEIKALSGGGTRKGRKKKPINYGY